MGRRVVRSRAADRPGGGLGGYPAVAKWSRGWGKHPAVV